MDIFDFETAFRKICTNVKVKSIDFDILGTRYIHNYFT